MYKAFFVDDEPLVLETIINMPLLLECGFIIVGTSTNPAEAAKEIKKTKPDVVFTDLKMPKKTGVELMRELKQIGFEGQFVIISAYKEFEEARSFFKMDGFDYLVKPVSEEDLQKLLEKLSGKLASKQPGSPTNNDTASPELNRITAYLNENVSDKHTLETISDKFGLNPNYICNLFSRHLGTTFVSYITGIRMNEAANLLRTSKKSVKEISGLCGYHDYFYFCRVFRETYSCTPTSFREAAQ